MSPSQNFRVKLAPHLTLTEIEGKTVLFSKSTGDFFGLNESAGIFLKILTENDFLQSLQLARQEFAVSETDLERDLLELVQDLENQQLLTKIPV